MSTSTTNRHGNEDLIDKNNVSDSLIEDEATKNGHLKVYRRRWVIALLLGVLIMSNSKSRIGFGPVAYTSAEFYETEVQTINRFALVYMVVGIPMGFIATWIINRIGLGYSLISAAWIQLLGSLLRVFSAIESVSKNGKLILVFCGHVLSAIAQPFLMFAPTQMAANWFPDTERSTANSLMSLSNPLGILGANILSPLLVTQPEDIMKMLIVYLVPSVLGAIASLWVFRTDTPPIPPSHSARSRPNPFWTGMKQIMKNRQYWILFFSIGGGIGIYTVLTVFLEQILCPWGYPDFFAGVVCGSCLVLSGLVGALISSKITDHTKTYSLVAKISFIMCICSLAAFSFLQNHPNLEIPIVIACGMIGFFGLPLLPLGNELIVETTYPVEPTSSTGLVFLGGQLQGMLLVIVLQNLAKPVSPEVQQISKCHKNGTLNVQNYSAVVRDVTVPCYVFLGYAVFVCLCFVIFFRSANTRIKLEKKMAENLVVTKSSKITEQAKSVTSHDIES